MAARRAQNRRGARASLSHFLGWVVPLSQEAGRKTLLGTASDQEREQGAYDQRRGGWFATTHGKGGVGLGRPGGCTVAIAPSRCRRAAGGAQPESGEVWEERGRSGSTSSTEAASPAPSPQGNLWPRAAAPPATLTQSVPPWHYPTHTHPAFGSGYIFVTK